MKCRFCDGILNLPAGYTQMIRICALLLLLRASEQTGPFQVFTSSLGNEMLFLLCICCSVQSRGMFWTSSTLTQKISGSHLTTSGPAPLQSAAILDPLGSFRHQVMFPVARVDTTDGCTSVARVSAIKVLTSVISNVSLQLNNTDLTNCLHVCYLTECQFILSTLVSRRHACNQGCKNNNCAIIPRYTDH